MSSTLRFAVVTLMLVSAIALGLVGFQALRPPRPPPAPMATLAPVADTYLVAAHALPAGTLARDADFDGGSLAPGHVPEGAILNTPAARAELRGALIRTYIDAGHPITQADVLRPRDRGFLASVLGPGMRAISIAVDPVTGVSGLIWPGDHVDVILTQQLQKEPTPRRVLSETILSNVRIIAMDQQIVQGAPPDSTEAGKLARTATLEVTPEDAEKITVAAQLGQLSLAIRAARDAPGPVTTGTNPTFGADVSPALANTAQPVGQTVQVIQGEKRDEVTFR